MMEIRLSDYYSLHNQESEEIIDFDAVDHWKKAKVRNYLFCRKYPPKIRTTWKGLQNCILTECSSSHLTVFVRWGSERFQSGVEEKWYKYGLPIVSNSYDIPDRQDASVVKYGRCSHLEMRCFSNWDSIILLSRQASQLLANMESSHIEEKEVQQKNKYFYKIKCNQKFQKYEWKRRAFQCLSYG